MLRKLFLAIGAAIAIVAPAQTQLEIPDFMEGTQSVDSAEVDDTDTRYTGNPAIDAFIKARVMYGPGKAVNAGGVATSGLEMTQNAQKLSWNSEEVDEKLKSIMQNIHEQCVKYGKQADGYTNYVKGANVAGFMKVAKAMMAQGIL